MAFRWLCNLICESTWKSPWLTSFNWCRKDNAFDLIPPPCLGRKCKYLKSFHFKLLKKLFFHLHKLIFISVHQNEIIDINKDEELDILHLRNIDTKVYIANSMFFKNASNFWFHIFIGNNLKTSKKWNTQGLWNGTIVIINKNIIKVLCFKCYNRKIMACNN